MANSDALDKTRELDLSRISGDLSDKLNETFEAFRKDAGRSSDKSIRQDGTAVDNDESVETSDPICDEEPSVQDNLEELKKSIESEVMSFLKEKGDCFIHVVNGFVFLCIFVIVFLCILLYRTVSLFVLVFSSGIFFVLTQSILLYRIRIYIFLYFNVSFLYFILV